MFYGVRIVLTSTTTDSLFSRSGTHFEQLRHAKDNGEKNWRCTSSLQNFRPGNAAGFAAFPGLKMKLAAVANAFEMMA
jgi:hypothetical protein